MTGQVAQLLTLLLFIVLSPPCHAYCPLVTMDYRRCELYNELESALVADPQNLYRLHEEFFPSSMASPVYGDVIYILPCTRESSNSTQINSTVYVYTDWSSSILLAYLSPLVVNSFQVQLLDFLLSFTTSTRPNVLSELEFVPELMYSRYESWHVSLVLEMNNAAGLTTCDRDSVEELRLVLMDLTSWLKSYARAQGSRTGWHPLDITQYKGYSYSSRVDVQDPVLVQLPYLLLAIDIFSLILVTIFVLKLAPSFYCIVVRKTRRGNKWYSYIWATVVVTAMVNLTTLVLEVYSLRVENVKTYVETPCKECSQNIIGYSEKFDGDSTKAAGIQLYKTLTIFLLFVIDFIIALFIPKDSTLPIPRGCLYLSYGACCTFRFTHAKRSKLVQVFAIWSLLGFVHIVATSILPAALWVIVLPAETVSILTLMAAWMFCGITFLSLVIRNIRKVCFKTLTLKGACLFFMPILSLLVLTGMLVIASIIYIRLVTTRIDTSSFGGFLATFLPGVGLTVVGWIVTKGNPVKFVLNQNWKETNSNEEGEEKEKSDVFSESESYSVTPVAIEMETTPQTANNSLKEPLLTT